MAGILTQRPVVKRNRNGRTPTTGGSSGGTFFSSSSSSGGVSSSEENTWLASQTFSEVNYYEKTNWFQDVLAIGISSGYYGSLTANQGTNEIDAVGDFRFADDVYIDGNLNIQGILKSYSQDEINVGDSWFNLGVADVVGQDGGLRIYDSLGTSILSKFWYDVSEDYWVADGAGNSDQWQAGYNHSLAVTGQVHGMWTKTGTDVSYNGGNLGLGISSPNMQPNGFGLHIDSASTISADFHMTNSVSGNTSVSGILIQLYNSNAYLFNYEDGDLSFGTSGQERVVIDADGKMGIGVDPIYNFDVVGDGRFTSNIYTDNIIQNTITGLTILADNGIVFQNSLGINAASIINRNVFLYGTIGMNNYASQTTGWRVDADGSADFRYIYTDELRAQAFTADISQALAGSDVLTKSVSKLSENFIVPVTSGTEQLIVDDLEGLEGIACFVNGDYIRLRVFDRSGGGLIIADVWGTVVLDLTYGVGGFASDNTQAYTFTCTDDGGVDGNSLFTGSIVLDYGTSGDGLIESTVLDAAGAPYSQIATWVTDPSISSNFTVKTRTGNLGGITSSLFGALSGYGFYASGNAYFEGSINSTNGEVGAFTIGSETLHAGSLIGAGAGVAMNSTNKSFMAYADSNNYISMYYTSASNWNLKGVNGGNTFFSLGYTNILGSFTFNDTYLFTGTEQTSDTYTSSGITIGNNAIRTPNFRVDTNGDVYAKDAFFENCTISGRFSTEVDVFFLSGSNVVEITPDTNTIALRYGSTVSVITKIRKAGSRWVDGQIFRLIAYGDSTYVPNFTCYCDDASFKIRMKHNGNLADSTSSGQNFTVYNYRYDSGGTDFGSGSRYVATFMYVDNGSYLVEI